MATFSRKALKAMGIEDEKVDSIIEMHTDVTEALKTERDTYKDKAEKFDVVQKELNEANDKLAKYSESGETISKADFDKLKGEYDTYKAEQTAKETRSAKVNALSELYKDIGISEKRIATIIKTKNLDEIKLDKDGKLVDADAFTASEKTEWADFIETTTTKGAKTATPPANGGNGGAKTKAEIMAIKNDAERQAAILENRQLFGI